MKRFHLGALLRAAAVSMVLGFAGPAMALDELLLIAPAAPGGDRRADPPDGGR